MKYRNILRFLLRTVASIPDSDTRYYTTTNKQEGGDEKRVPKSLKIEIGSNNNTHKRYRQKPCNPCNGIIDS